MAIFDYIIPKGARKPSARAQAVVKRYVSRFRRRRFRRNKRVMRYKRMGGRQMINYKGFPRVLFTKIQYTADIATAGVTSAYYKFDMNAPNQPRGFGVATTRPMFYDELRALYDSAICYAAKIEITSINQQNESAIVAIFPSTDPTFTLGTPTDVQRRSTTHRVIGSQTGGNNVCTTKFFARTSRFCKTRDNLYIDFDNDDLVSVPMQRWYIYFALGSMTTQNIEVENLVRVTYYMKYFDMKQVGYSSNYSV